MSIASKHTFKDLTSSLHFLFCGFALFSQSGFPNDCETHQSWRGIDCVSQLKSSLQSLINQSIIRFLSFRFVWFAAGNEHRIRKHNTLSEENHFFVILLSWKTPVFELMRGKISNFPSIKKRKTPWLMIYYRNDVLSLIVIRENPITEVLFCFGLFDVEMLASRSLKETVILKINTTISPVKTWDLFELNFSVNSTLTLLCQKILNDF